ncbi:hypothetical protein BUALT_Bualt16G0016500 [Buddleja alternifolia]|uniref:Lipid II flippase MurJ n=2 Tax=Lamiales TaxID=4143 RepID=A0AAV6WDM5_9LAMI|nr:hypothetical protein BUALT_Bualt16G0016500 [Buddleja alternifolia]
MIKARIAFNLHSPLNSPHRSSHSPIRRSSLRVNPFPRRFRRIQIAFCAETSVNSSSGDDLSLSKVAAPSGGKSVDAATWIGVATLTSKILGLLREITMASVFGVGPVATAFKYAWVLPGFSSSLLGGVNGPIHIIMATTLSKLPKERQKKLFQHLTTSLFLIGGVVGALVYIFTEFIIHIYAPGLWISTEGQVIREIAIQQHITVPTCANSAVGNNILPSISPAFSSSLLIVSCLIYAFTRRLNASFPGGIVVSIAVSLGLLVQWIVQVVVLRRRWSDIIPDSLNNIFTSGDVREFFSLLLPATVSSGLAQIASFTDLCFASLIPGAAAGLSYAYLMVMAPLGALSSLIVLPLVPTFSKLVKTSSWESLVDNLVKVLLRCMVVLLPLFSTMRFFAEPIIHILFERFAFDSSASALVSTLFLAYSLGAPFFIARDLLVAVFYALGDGKGPFLVSAGAIALNAVLDWLSVSRFNLGARGLALSTSFTAAVSVFLLFYLLQRKLSGLSNYGAIIYSTTLLWCCYIISSLSTSASYKLICKLLSSTFLLRYNLMKELLGMSVATVIGIIAFFVPAILLHLSGIDFAKDLHRMLTKDPSLGQLVPEGIPEWLVTTNATGTTIHAKASCS